MTAPLSRDLRRRLVRAVEAGSSAREAARRFEVSPSAAVKIVRRARETGVPSAQPDLSGWQEALFGFLSRNAVRASDHSGCRRSAWWNWARASRCDEAE